MLEAVPLLAVTFLFVSSFIWSIAQVQLDDVRANWDSRRCEPTSMLIAQMVPTDPTVNTTDFAFDNFRFCINQVIATSLSTAFAPVSQLFQKQMDLTQPMSQVLNNLRGSALSLLGPATGMFGMVWERFRILTFQILRIFAKLAGSLDRIFGIAISSVFMGMGLTKALMNSIGFTIRVAIVLIIILSILVIWLWFIMWPVIPIILTAIGFISASVYAGDVAGVSGSFCVAPDTLVETSRGWVRADSIRPGEELPGGIVEGVLEACGGPCVSIDGVILSEIHLLLHNGKWIPAGHHPKALEVRTSPDRLYCLNTSSHIWRVKATLESPPLILRDWEELPDGFDAEWEQAIAKLLGSLQNSVPGRGLLGEWTTVWTQEEGAVQIRSVKVGDCVRDGDGSYTRVLAVYHDTSEFIPIAGPNQAAWIWDRNGWSHPRTTDNQITAKDGWHLITESGTFQAGQHIVRDFTEVGIQKLPLTSDFVMERLSRSC